MKLVFFSKTFQQLDADHMIDAARRFGFEGYDLCCRPGYPVTPENMKTELPKITSKMAAANLVLPMISSPGDLCNPNDQRAEYMLAAMQTSSVKLLKIGYFLIDHAKEEYWEKVSSIRRKIEGWSKLGGKYEVKICYHTHSGAGFMGLNAAAIMHLVKDFDPKTIGVYLDPGHLLLDGERSDIAFNMVQKYLAIIGLKDTAKLPSLVGHGWTYNFCRAGFGHVNWPEVFDHLVRLDFSGPLSVHAEYDSHYPEEKEENRSKYIESLKEEFSFFKRMRSEAMARH